VYPSACGELLYTYNFCIMKITGADPGGGGRTRRPPKIGKNMIFGRKIVIFHTKYPKNFHASLRQAHFL
jgi:hypothetical protein